MNDCLYYKIESNYQWERFLDIEEQNRTKAVFFEVNSKSDFFLLEVISNRIKNYIKNITSLLFLFINTDFNSELLEFSTVFDFVIFNKDRQVELTEEELRKYVENNYILTDSNYYSILKKSKKIEITNEELQKLGIVNYAITEDGNNDYINNIKAWLGMLEAEQIKKIKEYTNIARMSAFSEEIMLQKEMEIFCHLVRKKSKSEYTIDEKLNLEYIEYTTLRYFEENEIAYLVINMPPANKMIPEFLIEFIYLVENKVIKTNAKALIMYGEGRNFSAGADVEKLCQFIVSTCKKEKRNIPSWYQRIKKAFLNLSQMQIPVISLIRGCCIGSGFELAIHSHIVICEKGALIGLPEATFGLLPGMNGTVKSFQKLGYRKGMLFFLQGELISVNLDEKYAFVDYVVPKGTGLDFIHDFLNHLNKKERYSREKAGLIFHNYIEENCLERGCKHV